MSRAQLDMAIEALIAGEVEFARREREMKEARQTARSLALDAIEHEARSIGRDSRIIAFADRYWDMEGFGIAGLILKRLGVEHTNQIVDILPEKGIGIGCSNCGDEITARTHEERKRHPEGYQLREGAVCYACSDLIIKQRWQRD